MRAAALASRNMKELFRDPLTIALGVAMPVGLQALFVAIGKRAPLPIFEPRMMTPAIIVFGFAFLVMFSATLLSKDRRSAFLTRLLATPLKPLDFIAAYALPFAPVAVLQLSVCYAVGLALGVPLSLGTLASLLVLLPEAMACVGIGLILGSLFDDNQIAGIGSILISVVGIMCGAWMDLGMVGGIIEAVAYILPFAHAVDAARALANGAAIASVAGHLAVVYAYAVALLAAGIAAFALKTRRK